ncbi:response regulator transcription factor [Sphingobacterium pedocola]|uniref:DNA-binding response regulator n=1 Tax=Sphingobacterium pedocola TaxID=2082722 RepID=A0ABR9TAZ8_9SPHI|nr:response regulator transcription factor [Sphingobacterium pedocola]MBE8722523.1 DNA-binding response regulator [Sphingobacterium pedocola]
MIKIMLADDHKLVRDGIRLLLESQEDIEIVGVATNGQDVLKLLDEGLQPDILLSDISMEPLDGIELAKIISKFEIRPAIIILSMMDNEQYIARSFESGVSAYLVKNVNSEELLSAIRYVAAGGKYLCEELSMQYVNRLISNRMTYPDMPNKVDLNLSVRELEVLEKLGEGLTNNEISDKLFLSKRTIEGHRQNLIQKTGCKNTASLIKFAVLNGLIK